MRHLSRRWGLRRSVHTFTWGVKSRVDFFPYFSPLHHLKVCCWRWRIYWQWTNGRKKTILLLLSEHKMSKLMTTTMNSSKTTHGHTKLVVITSDDDLILQITKAATASGAIRAFEITHITEQPTKANRQLTESTVPHHPSDPVSHAVDPEWFLHEFIGVSLSKKGRSLILVISVLPSNCANFAPFDTAQ